MYNLQSRKNGPVEIILVGYGGAEERQDRIAHQLGQRALVAIHMRYQVLKAPFMIWAHASGSNCSAAAVEPVTSQKSMVTTLRSP